MTVPSTIPLGDATMRPWSTADERALATALASSEAHLRRWTPWVVDGKVLGQPLRERLARHAAAFAAGEEWVFGLFGGDGAVLGGCGLYPRLGPGAIELGYWLAASATGRGLATRASAALVRVAFDMPGVDRVEIRCEAANAASARVPRRLGFHLAPEPVHASSTPLQCWTLGRAEFVARGGGASAAT